MKLIYALSTLIIIWLSDCNIQVEARQPSQRCYDIIKSFEGFYANAYADPGKGIMTIGYGTIKYPNGRAVRRGDTITRSQAEQYLQWEVNSKARDVDAAIGSGVSLYQSQFDALVSFTYNLGIGALRRSDLLKKVKTNPQDRTIRNEFMRWVYAGGKKLRGLVNRRAAEADLYFSY